MTSNVKLVISVCGVCNKEFQAINYRLLHGRDKYCSRACRGKSPEFKEQLAKMIETRRRNARTKHPKWREGKRVCLDCDKIININSSRCRECQPISQKGATREGIAGDKNYNWNGGKTLSKEGYILVNSPYHPYKNNHGYVREHRLVMERSINRFLLPDEEVHHLNGNKTDNRASNLIILSKVDHARLHLYLRDTTDK